MFNRNLTWKNLNGSEQVESIREQYQKKTIFEN